MEEVFPKNSEVAHQPLLDHMIEAGRVENIQHNKGQKKPGWLHQFQMFHRDVKSIAQELKVNQFVHGWNTVDCELDLEDG